ncbi:MAG: hypothetical protein PHQ23_04545 [Candidatus Wallbacteria bacterium]|nr:hypothetical protein [Candidatus Wallbacteria bacterium]
MNQFGMVVRDEWIKTPGMRCEIAIDEYIVMPDHFHAIVWITRENDHSVGANGRSPLHGEKSGIRMAPRSLSSLMAGFKSVVTKRINAIRNTPGIPVWQRNYYDRIIRNELELKRIREYIANNPIDQDHDRANMA